MAIGIVVRGGRVLICRRRKNAADPFGGLWEFPGGKFRVGETPRRCVVREVREEVALTMRVIRPLAVIEHDYPTVRVRLHPFICQADQSKARPMQVSRIRWVRPARLVDYEFPAANRQLIRRLARGMIVID